MFMKKDRTNFAGSQSWGTNRSAQKNEQKYYQKEIKPGIIIG